MIHDPTECRIDNEKAFKVLELLISYLTLTKLTLEGKQALSLFSLEV